MQRLTSAQHAQQINADDDDALTQRAARGDEHAFESLMRRHNRLLFRTARGILKSDSETEDALQEAYLRAWRALGTSVPNRSSRPGWCGSS